MSRAHIKKVSAFFVVFFMFPMMILAQTGGTSGGGTGAGTSDTSGGKPLSITIPNPVAGNGNLWDFINTIIQNIVLPLGAVLAVLYIMYAGFLMVTARGNETKLKDARAAFLHAAIGTAILLGAWVIANVIKSTICSIDASACLT